MEECVALHQFRTQQAIMAGTWGLWSEENERQHVRILVREANQGLYEDEPDVIWL